jgi:hypothetical protein
VDRQGIHVGAQPNRPRGVATAEHANHAGPTDETMHLKAPGREQARHDVCRAVGLKTELGMSMDIATDAGQLRVIGTHPLERGASAKGLGHDGSHFDERLDAAEATIAG